VVEGSRIRREYPITTGRLEGHGKKGKALTADYILEYKNTKLAVNEAKAWGLPLTEGAAQAKNYAEKLSLRHAYCTNGQGIYAMDMQTGEEKEIQAYPLYHTPSHPDASPRSDRFRCGGRESKFLAAGLLPLRRLGQWPLGDGRPIPYGVMTMRRSR
jgi:hypothetical protein